MYLMYTIRPMANLIRIHEASHIIGVTPATIRRWIKSGLIDYTTLPNGERRIEVDEVARILSEGKRRGVKAAS